MRTRPQCVCVASHAYEIAEFILHRVHCHEKLVEALEQQQKMCQAMGIDLPDCETCQRRFPTNTDCKLCAAVKLTKEKP